MTSKILAKMKNRSLSLTTLLLLSQLTALHWVSLAVLTLQQMLTIWSIFRTLAAGQTFRLMRNNSMQLLIPKTWPLRSTK